MNQPQVVISPIQEAEMAAAGTLMEHMWRLHGEQVALLNVDKILIDGAQYIRGLVDSNNSAVFIAKQRAEVVGVVSCTIRTLPTYYSVANEAYIDDLCVAEEHQRQGIAGLLLQACEDFAKHKGVRVLSAKVWAFNRPSAGTLEQNGFSNDYSLFHKYVD